MKHSVGVSKDFLPMPDEAIQQKLRKLDFVLSPDRVTPRREASGSCPCERSATPSSPNPGGRTRPRSEKKRK